MNRQEKIKLIKARSVLKAGASPEEVKQFLADIRGEKGDDGERGLQGIKGEKGLPGVPGRNGLDGKDGRAGLKGKDGSPGRDGIDGKGIVWLGQWETLREYYVNNAVFNRGSAYICIAEHKSRFITEPGLGDDWHKFWAVLAEKGERGEGGAAGANGASGSGSGGGIAMSINGNNAGTPALISSGTLYLGGGNNITLSQNGQSISLIGGAGAGGGIAISGSNAMITSGTASYVNANGVSWSVNGQSISASVQTNYQPTGNYLTTARASNDGIGLVTAGTNVTLTANSAGFSFNGGGYAGTGITTASTAGTDIVGTNNTLGLSLGIPKYQSTGNYLTTAMQSASSSVFAKTGFTSASTAGTDIVGTHDTAGLSLGIPKYITTAQPVGAYLTTARASTDALGLNTAGSNMTWTANSSGVSIDARGYAGTGTSVTNATITLNSNGLQFNGGAYLTTARASNDAVGLNTAKTNVSWTVNSSGISLDAGGYAGTGFTTASTAGTDIVGTQNNAGLSMGIPKYQSTGNYLTTAMQSGASTQFVQGGAAFAGTNASGTIASNGISVSVAAPGAGGGLAVADAANTVSTGTMQLTNANGVSWSLNGQTLSGSVATTYAGSNHSHGNPTLNLTNLSGTTASASNGLTLSLSAQASSSLVASGNLTFSSAGSTITASVGNPALSRYELPNIGISSISNGTVPQGSLSFQRHYVPLNVTATAAAIGMNISNNTNTSATTASANITLNMGIYQLSGSTLSLVSSGSANNGYAWSQSASTTANTSVDGLRLMTVPMNINMTPGVYWLAAAISSQTTYTGAAFTLHGNPGINTSASNAAFSPLGGATSNGGAFLFQGIYTAATNTLPQSVVGSGDINQTSASNVARANIYMRLYNATY